MKEEFFRVRRKVDGKFATQKQFFGPVNWGKGKMYHREKAAERLFRDVVYKRNSKGWPGCRFWGTIQLVKFNIEGDRIYEEILKEL